MPLAGLGLGLLLQPIECGQRLADDLIHAVALVGRQAADEGDIGELLGILQNPAAASDMPSAR